MAKEVKRRHPKSERFRELVQAMIRLCDEKSEGYGSPDDPFQNIVNGARAWNMPPWVGAMIRLCDKVARLQAYHSKGEQVGSDSPFDDLRDIGIYSQIAYVELERQLHEGSNPSTPQPAD